VSECVCVSTDLHVPGSEPTVAGTTPCVIYSLDSTQWCVYTDELAPHWTQTTTPTQLLLQERQEDSTHRSAKTHASWCFFVDSWRWTL